MKQCKECLEMYEFPHPTAGFGKFRLFGDHCPKCGTFNSDFNKNSIISFTIFIVIAAMLYFMGIL